MRAVLVCVFSAGIQLVVSQHYSYLVLLLILLYNHTLSQMQCNAMDVCLLSIYVGIDSSSTVSTTVFHDVAEISNVLQTADTTLRNVIALGTIVTLNFQNSWVFFSQRMVSFIVAIMWLICGYYVPPDFVFCIFNNCSNISSLCRLVPRTHT